jgi:hypothetical protein
MWTTYISNPQSIKSIFGSIPDLSSIELMEIILRQGEQVDLRFNVIPYPDKPPTKWKEYNTVQVILSLFLVENFQLHNWQDPIKGICTVTKNSDAKIDFKFQSKGCTFICQTAAMLVQKISAYHDTRRK